MKSFFPLPSSLSRFKANPKAIFIILSGLIAVWMLWISRDYGITWDEWSHALNGTFSLRYLLGDVKDLSLLNQLSPQLFCDPLYMATGFVYGGVKIRGPVDPI